MLSCAACAPTAALAARVATVAAPRARPRSQCVASVLRAQQAYAVEKENLALIEHKSLIDEAEDLLLAGAARGLKSKSA